MIAVDDLEVFLTMSFINGDIYKIGTFESFQT